MHGFINALSCLTDRCCDNNWNAIAIVEDTPLEEVEEEEEEGMAGQAVAAAAATVATGLFHVDYNHIC